MKILITGAGGFLGKCLTTELLKDPTHQLLLTDVYDFTTPVSGQYSSNATCIQADLLTDCDKVIQDDLDAVFILHGIMSSGAEAQFDLGFKINVDATHCLLDGIRMLERNVRVIYTSSIAVYGRPFSDMITEETHPTPEGSYGCEKLICETIINEYTRRGYVDGFIVRAPGVTVRTGPPAAAASSFLSGIVRDSLAGKRCIIPTLDRSKNFWICSPKIMVANLVRVLGLPSSVLPPHRRVLNAPGSIVNIQQMRDAVAKIAGNDKLNYIEETEDTSFAKLVQSWPYNFDVSLALSLGLLPAEGFEKAVQDYVDGLTTVPRV